MNTILRNQIKHLINNGYKLDVAKQWYFKDFRNKGVIIIPVRRESIINCMFIPKENYAYDVVDLRSIYDAVDTIDEELDHIKIYGIV